MTHTLAFEIHRIRPLVYQIRVEGQLGSQWTDWFGGMTIAPQDNGDTVLTGAVLDQAALYGLLKKFRDLGLVLVALNRVERRLAYPADGSGENHPYLVKEEKK